MEGKVCEFEYLGNGNYRSGCGKVITAEQVRELDKTNGRYCPECKRPIEWPDPLRTSGKKGG